MKPTHISIAVLFVCLIFAPAVLAQSPDSVNQSTAPSIQSASAAEVPRLIKFGGTLLDAQDRPMAGPVGVTFALYAQQTGGAALWMETQNVKPDASGVYTILLGANSANGVPAELFASAEARWLGIQVGQQPELARILLVSVPYALKAGDAQTLGGRPASAFVTTETVVSGGTSAATMTAAAPTSASSPSTSTASPTSSAQTTSKKAASGPLVSSCAVTSDGTGAVNSLAKFITDACHIMGSGISENGSSQVGIGGAPLTTAKLFLADSQINFGSGGKWLQKGLFTTSATSTGTNVAFAFDLDMTNMLVSTGVTDSGSRTAFRSLSYANNPGFAGTLFAQSGLLAQAGIRVATSGAKVTNAYGGQFLVFNQVPGTTITNAYGVWISNTGTGGMITNRYDLYASSPNANNFFAGKVGIGKTTPAAPLDVVGNINSSGTVTGTQLISTVPGGLPPLSVTSSTQVPNLNASFLGNFPPGAFAFVGAPNVFTGNNVFSATNAFTADQSISTSDSTPAPSLTVTQNGTGNGPALSVTQKGNGMPGFVGTGPGVVVNQAGVGDALQVNVAAGPAFRVDGQGNTLLGGPLGLFGAPLVVVRIKNDTTTGTTVNSVAKLTCPNECFAIKTTTSDIGGAVGTVLAGAGTTGHANVVLFGIVNCNFDNTATAGDYVQLSSTVAGDCHDVGASYPASGQVLGRIIPPNKATTPTCNGLCQIFQFIPEIRP